MALELAGLLGRLVGALTGARNRQKIEDRKVRREAWKPVRDWLYEVLESQPPHPQVPGMKVTDPFARLLPTDQRREFRRGLDQYEAARKKLDRATPDEDDLETAKAPRAIARDLLNRFDQS
jgi:hypothetical protein